MAKEDVDENLEFDMIKPQMVNLLHGRLIHQHPSRGSNRDRKYVLPKNCLLRLERPLYKVCYLPSRLYQLC